MAVEDKGETHYDYKVIVNVTFPDAQEEEFVHLRLDKVADAEVDDFATLCFRDGFARDEPFDCCDASVCDE